MCNDCITDQDIYGSNCLLEALNNTGIPLSTAVFTHFVLLIFLFVLFIYLLLCIVVTILLFWSFLCMRINITNNNNNIFFHHHHHINKE